MDKPLLLQVNNLTTRFHTEDGTVFAVNGISYDLHESESVGIVGESGCGKSVHALSIMRLIPVPPGEIVDGSVIFQDRDLLSLSDDEVRQIRGNQIAMVFQDPMTSLNPVLTIGLQITEALTLHLDMTEAEAKKRAAELLEWVGIPEAAQRLGAYPHEFSGGMRQRAMIAMALSCSPQLLIADEPTTALDVTIQAQIIELIKRLRDETGMAIVWITHDLGIIAGLVERVLVMYAGFVVEAATVKNLFADPRHPYTLGLMGSLPRIDVSKKSGRLVSIDGLPPDLVGLPVGCPFAPRCSFVIDRCRVENPELVEVTPDHKAACWVDIREHVSQEAAK